MSAGGDIRVELSELSGFGPHGVTEAERMVGCRIVLDISFTVSGCAAITSDEIEDTVDYGAVAALATEIVSERSFRTLERLCGVIVAEINERFEVTDLEVRAAKPEPPIPQSIRDVAVTLLVPEQ